MGLADATWVLFKHDYTIHREVYFVAMGPNGAVTTEHSSEALGFETPALAYSFAAHYAPILSWWRVGLRG